MKKLIGVFTFVLLFSVGAWAVGFCCKSTIVQKIQNSYSYDGDRFIEIGESQKTLVPEEQSINVLVWNLEKYKSKKTAAYVSQFEKESDLMLFQEAMVGDKYTDFMASLSNWSWKFAVGFFKNNGNGAGVATASRFIATDAFMLESNPKEPVTRTPKMAMITKHAFNNGQLLLVINIHGINFVGLGTFKKHIRQFEEVLKNHQGPIIFAGDFNTWNAGRFKFLSKFNAQFGLENIELANDTRRVKFDRVFTRGLKVFDAEVLNKINSSDHFPIRFKVKL